MKSFTADKTDNYDALDQVAVENNNLVSTQQPNFV